MILERKETNAEQNETTNKLILHSLFTVSNVWTWKFQFLLNCRQIFLAETNQGHLSDTDHHVQWAHHQSGVALLSGLNKLDSL